MSIKMARCNKCGLSVPIIDTQEAELLLNSLHTFSSTFEFTGEDDSLDMKYCSFTICKKCLLDMFANFLIEVDVTDSKEWNLDER